MTRNHDRVAARPLPRGLRICATCGEARGRTPRGRVSACYCSGLICNRCGEPRHRPITDYYDYRGRTWTHVPWFGLMAHTCRLEPGEAPHGTGWTHLEPDPEVIADQAETTRIALAEMEARLALQRAGEDRDADRVKPGHPS